MEVSTGGWGVGIVNGVVGGFPKLCPLNRRVESSPHQWCPHRRKGAR